MRLISCRACELSHQTGLKLMTDISKWDHLQHFEVRPMVKAYYENFMINNMKTFIFHMEDGATKDLFNKLFTLYMKVLILQDGEYF